MRYFAERRFLRGSQSIHEQRSYHFRPLRVEPLEDRRMLALDTLYVDADAAGADTGATWTDAHTDLQVALSSAETLNADADPANDITAIWIADGTYLPTAELEPGDVRSASFSLVDGASLFGGFAGTEATLAERVMVDGVFQNETILSGDLGTPDDNSDNAYTVVYCGENVAATVDAISITGGNADGSYVSGHSERSNGGGIYNNSGTLTVANSTISGNLGSSDGGGIYNDLFSTSTVTNSTISGNSATGNFSSGGGMHNSGTLAVTNSSIIGNSSLGSYGGGGGIDSTGTLAVTNSTLSGNSAIGSDGGGGIYNSGMLAVTNSVFIGNLSTGTFGKGGGIRNTGTLAIANSTLSGNSTTGSFDGGGGIHNAGTLTVTNSIVAANEASNLSPDLYLFGSTVTGQHNLICDGSGQTTLIDGVDGNLVGTSSSPLDPGFVRNPSDGGDGWADDPATGVDESANNDYGDLRLTHDSPAIDMGDGSLLPADTFDLDNDLDTSEPIPVDRDGNPRIRGDAVDAGAYEATSFTLSQRRFVQGTVDVGIGMYPGGTVVRLYALAGEEQVEIGSGSAEVNDFVWDSTGVSDGRVTLLAEWFDEQGKVVHAASRQVIVANGVDFAIHHEDIDGNTTWAAGVHVVTEKLDIGSGAALTIEAGAVVKFLDGTGLNVAAGATLTAADDVVFTHIADDTAGGDTNLDAAATAPRHDQYFLAGAGTISLGNSELRYLTQEYSGTLSASQLWTARQVIRVIGDVAVPAGVVLDIEPGAIVKFDPGTSLSVQSGGELNATGTLARPIVFTSIHDDAHGGDTNRNDDSTRPEAGDWHQIHAAGGTIDIEYARISYCSQQNNQGGLYLSGGTITFDNSVLSDTQFDAVRNDGGTFTARNSVFTESSLALRPSSGTSVITNCTISNVTTAVRGGAGTFTNCVFANIPDTIEEWGPSTFQYSVFWNPPGFGPQSTSQVGQNNNLWADPLFRDPENGDFTLRPGSPLIDAADGSVAPTTDFFGNPRFDDPWVENLGTPDADGAYVDIGAFEMVEGADSELDLAVGWVVSPTQATIGDMVELRWQVVNTGVKVIDGEWRDSIWLVSDAGQVVAIGDVQQQASIGVGETIECAAQVAIPSISEGIWRFRVRLNAYRDLFEGSNIFNNAALSEGHCTIAAPAFPVVDGISDQAVLNTEPRLYKLTVPAGQSLLLAGDSSEPVAILASEGFAPSDHSFDWQASVYGDHQYSLSIPASGVERTIYVRISTTRPDATFSLAASFDAFSLNAVSTHQISNTGSSTLTITGAGFEPGMTFSLQRVGDAPISGGSLIVASASSASARFDMTGAATGVYTLSVTSADGLRTESLPDAVTVIDGIGNADALEAWLDIPDTVREGRVYTGYANYANTGDVDMLAPVLYVKSNSEVQFAALPDDLDAALDSLPLLGASPTSPAGTLKPGESSRVPFYFVARSRNHVLLSSLSDQDIPMDVQEHWDTWQDYHEALADAATRLVRRGGNNWGYQACHDLAVRTASGLPTAAVSGHLRNGQTGEALVGISLHGVYHDGAEDVGMIIRTDQAGYFQFRDLPESVNLQISCNEAFGLSQLSFTLPSADVNGVVLTAMPYGAISGRLSDVEGRPLEWIQVIASAGENESASGVSDATGFYRIAGLSYDTYDVGVFSTMRDGIVVSSGREVTGVDFTLNSGRIQGSVIDWSSLPVVGTLVLATDENGNSVVANTDDSGEYRMEGILDGTWTVEARSGVHLDIEPIEVVVGIGQALNADFQLLEGASVSGTVTDELGEPLQGVQVCASDGDNVYRTSFTDVNGAYQIRGLEVNSHELSTRYFGNVDSAFAECIIASLDQEVLGMDVVLVEASAVSGSILAASDATPIANATVMIRRNGMTETYVVEPDAFGSYAISNVAPGIYDVEVTAPGYARFNTMIDALNSSSITLDVLLEAGGTLSGRVISANGQVPISDVRVVLLRSGYFYESTVSNEDGSYLFEEIPEGWFTCMAVHESLAFPAFELEMTSEESVVHDFIASSTSVQGSVFTPDGVTLLDGGTMYFALIGDEPFGSSSVSTDIAEDGSYQIGSLLPGTYVVVIHSDAGVAAFEEELPGTSTQSFVLSSQYQVTVSLESDDSGLLSEAERIAVYTHDNVFLTSMPVAEASSSQFSALPEGNLLFVVLSENRILGHETVTIDRDLGITLPVSNDGLAERSLIVRDPNTRLPLANQVVQITVVGAPYSVYATTDQYGLITVLLPDGAPIAAESDTAVLVEDVQPNGLTTPSGQSVIVSYGPFEPHVRYALAASAAPSITPWARRLDRLNAQREGLARTISSYPDELTECSCPGDCACDRKRLFSRHDSMYKLYLSTATRDLTSTDALSQSAARLTEDIVDRAGAVGMSIGSLAVSFLSKPFQIGWTAISLGKAAWDLYQLPSDIAAPLLRVIDNMKAELSGFSGDAEEVGELLHAAAKDLASFSKAGLEVRSAILTNVCKRMARRVTNCRMRLANAEKYVGELWLGQQAVNIEDFRHMNRALKSVRSFVNALGRLLAVADVYTVINGLYMIARNLSTLYSQLDQYESLNADIRRNISTANHWSDTLPACVCNPPEEKEDESDPETPQSCDPNEISGPVGYDTAEDLAAMEAWRLEHQAQGHLCDDDCPKAPPLHNWIQPGGRMVYSVYFENLSSATAAAQEVFVDHQLNENLDWSTFAMQEVVFGDQIVDTVRGTAAGSVTVDSVGTPYQVVIDTSIDYATGEIDWYLRSFDPATFDNWPTDPYAGFLPPNDETHRGEGHITFSVTLNDDLQTDDAIHSEAEIVFDYNEPIATDPSWTNTIDVTTPESSVNALPADSPATFVVSWAGTDEGSGVGGYDIHVSIDGEPEVLWQTTTDTSATYSGSLGHTYAFYSIAIDNVGHRESAPPTPDTETTVMTATTGARLDMALVHDSSVFDDEVTGERELLPANEEWIDEWESFWIEIWVSTPGTTDTGVVSAEVDLNYDTEYFTATEIEYGPGFDLLRVGTVDDVAGVVTDLGAGTEATDVGDDRHALLARVRFEATVDDPGVPLDADGKYFVPVDSGFALSNAEVMFGGPVAADVVLGDPPDTEVWPVMYDVDDDQRIGFGDFAYFATAFQQNVGESGATHAWATDFDRSGRVDFGDFAFFATNFQRARGGAAAIAYDQGFPVAWRASALLLETPLTPPPASAALVAVTSETLEPVLAEAMRRMEVAEDSKASEALKRVTVEIADLPDNQLGRSLDNHIWIDRDAAGYGWFGDPTPGDDVEFSRRAGTDELMATLGGPAEGRVDLLTTLMHELGHVFGREHSAESGVMRSTLSVGTRRSVVDERFIDDYWGEPG